MQCALLINIGMHDLAKVDADNAFADDLAATQLAAALDQRNELSQHSRGG